MIVLFIFVLAYLLGTIPFGLILTKAAGLGDVRQIGSGNIGATNVLRTGSKKLAAATLFLDGFKGYVAAALLLLLLPAYDNATLSADDFYGRQGWLWDVLQNSFGLAALCGHVWPVWLRFRGGKGVATYLGVLIALDINVAVCFAVVWIAVFRQTRISSRAALTASAVVAGLMILTFLLTIALFGSRHGYAAALSPANLLISVFATNPFIVLGATLLFYTHRANLARLRAGTEPRFGKGA